MNNIPSHIFREYDIRGIADRDIDEDFAYRLARAYARMLPGDVNHPVIVGRDVRLSGERFQAAVIHGLNDAGIDTLDIGISPTPLAYYGVYQLHAAGNVQITASHNPGNYNGFKMMIGKSSLHGSDIQRLADLMRQEIKPYSGRRGSNRQYALQQMYSDFIIQTCPLKRPLKVVIDAGNGPSGVIAAPLYRRMGCEVIELYCEPDGAFPNHHPDPSVAENMKDLADMVVSQHADLGIAFDGDGDRIGVVDHQGAVIWNDLLLLLLSKHLLKAFPGATIISEVKSSQHLYDGIQAAGGRAIMWRTGHSPIKAKMKETGALLAGEMSGHIFFADRFFGFDDATYAGARIMQMLTETGASFPELLSTIPSSTCTPEIRIPCADNKKFALVEQAIEHFRTLQYHVIDIDGMRIQFEDGWGLLRASNTQPALVLRFEACNAERLHDIRQLIESWLKSRVKSHGIT